VLDGWSLRLGRVCWGIYIYICIHVYINVRCFSFPMWVWFLVGGWCVEGKYLSVGEMNGGSGIRLMFFFSLSCLFLWLSLGNKEVWGWF